MHRSSLLVRVATLALGLAAVTVAAMPTIDGYMCESKVTDLDLCQALGPVKSCVAHNKDKRKKFLMVYAKAERANQLRKDAEHLQQLAKDPSFGKYFATPTIVEGSHNQKGFVGYVQEYYPSLKEHVRALPQQQMPADAVRSTVHELGHVLGMAHTVQRKDREAHLEFTPANVVVRPQDTPHGTLGIILGAHIVTEYNFLSTQHVSPAPPHTPAPTVPQDWSAVIPSDNDYRCLKHTIMASQNLELVTPPPPATAVSIASLHEAIRNMYRALETAEKAKMPFGKMLAQDEFKHG